MQRGGRRIPGHWRTFEAFEPEVRDSTANLEDSRSSKNLQFGDDPQVKGGNKKSLSILNCQ
jgi:hypothetical protein